MKFINHMKLDPDEIVSVEDIAPPSEDGTVVLTCASPGRFCWDEMDETPGKMAIFTRNMVINHGVLGIPLKFSDNRVF